MLDVYLNTGVIIEASYLSCFYFSTEPHSVELKGVGPGLVGVSERSTAEEHVGQLTRPRAFSQSAMHSLGDRGNTQALAELAQVTKTAVFLSKNQLSLLHCNY